jgi:hypothetical protein
VKGSSNDEGWELQGIPSAVINLINSQDRHFCSPSSQAQKKIEMQAMYPLLALAANSKPDKKL